MLKVALVGVGGISGAHIPVWKSMNDVELVALCDVRPERMERYPEQRHYTDFEEMLQKEQFDILDICLPTYLHADYAVKAMERGVNVLCEKPISLNQSDVARVYGTAKRMGVKFMVAQVLRFWPEYEAIKEIYDTGRYGRLLSGSMSRLGHFPEWSWDNWMRDEKRSGLVPYDLHIHDLDFLVYAFGAPVSQHCYRAKCADQDYLSAIYHFDGFSINAEAAWYAANYPFTAKFLFQFERAVVAQEGGVLKIYPCGGETIESIEGETGDSGVINLPKSNAYGNEIRYFTDCVKENRQPDKVKPEQLEAVIDILNNI